MLGGPAVVVERPLSGGDALPSGMARRGTLGESAPISDGVRTVLVPSSIGPPGSCGLFLMDMVLLVANIRAQPRAARASATGTQTASRRLAAVARC